MQPMIADGWNGSGRAQVTAFASVAPVGSGSARGVAVPEPAVPAAAVPAPAPLVTSVPPTPIPALVSGDTGGATAVTTDGVSVTDRLRMSRPTGVRRLRSSSAP